MKKRLQEETGNMKPNRSNKAGQPRAALWAFLLSLIFLPLTANAQTASRSAHASVQSPSMTLGQTNTYTIVLPNSHTPNISPPSAPGLQFASNGSTSSSMRIVNGVSSSQTRISWQFQAERAGKFVIPARILDLQGTQLQIPAVTVQVTDMPAERRNRFFLRWQLPEAPYFVGQAIPATLQLFVRADMKAGIGNAPSGSNEQFLQTPFSEQPRQKQGQMDGITYVVVEWDTIITPIRVGVGDLPVSLTLVYETGKTQRGMWGRQAVQDQIRLTTETANWEIRDLPRTGRPKSFSGAVGDFKVQSHLSAHEATAGEPLTFALAISGEGNFDRIRAPEISEADGWRIYPPRTQTEKSEEAPNEGVKTFEYIFTPQNASVTETPPVAFSWFDPHQEVWEERVLGSEPVEIKPGTTPPATSRASSSTSAPTAEDTALRPIVTSLGTSHTFLAPWQQPLFWVFNGGLGIAAAAVMFTLARKRKSDQNPFLHLQSAATRKGRELAAQATQAADRQDATGFYQNATQALRHFLAFLDPQSHNPESLTGRDLEKILQQFSFSEEATTQIDRLFQRQEASHFAGWQPEPSELQQDRETFASLLHQIARRKR